jgi:hypothetical protein
VQDVGLAPRLQQELKSSLAEEVKPNLGSTTQHDIAQPQGFELLDIDQLWTATSSISGRDHGR